MTTQEFLRRTEYFNALDGACIAINGRSFCWRIMQVFDNSVRTLYTHDVYYFVNEHPAFFTYCESVCIDKYTQLQFDIEVKYFKAFISRLSKFQLESLKASGKCSHLLDYVNSLNKKNYDKK